MVRPEVIRRRLENLDTYLEILTGMQRYSLSEFLSDPEHYGSADLELDRKRVYDIVQRNLEDLQALQRVFARFL